MSRDRTMPGIPLDRITPDNVEVMKSEIKNEINKQLVVIIAEPQDPKNLPNNPAKQEPIIGKKTNIKYI